VPKLAPNDGGQAEPERQIDLAALCEAADQILELVGARLRECEPGARDWNDRSLVLALARAYRCLRSVRELAGRGEAEDAPS